MRNSRKIYAVVLLVAIMTISLLFSLGRKDEAETISTNNVNLVLDSVGYKKSLPENFRKTSDLSNINNNKNLNLNGLDKLNISGSEQFSENNLDNLIKAIDTSQRTIVVDLRQESHGFINGLPVSWADKKNNANVGLSRKEVLEDEANRLKSIKLNVPLAFYNHQDKKVTPEKVEDENKLVSGKGLSYERITVRDGGIPNDDMVDYFVEFVKNQSQDSWLHFHCKQGIGRTTTFMIMYDMMKNYKEASADHIINRQLELAKFDASNIKSFNSNERLNFLRSFYDYCKANGDKFNTTWSKWKSK